MTAVERISSYASLPPEAGYSETLCSYKEKEKGGSVGDLVVKTEAYKGQIAGNIQLKRTLAETISFLESI